MSAYLWVPNRLEREEVPEEWWDQIDFDNQELRFGASGQGKTRRLYVGVRCAHCGEEFQRAVSAVRQRIKRLRGNYSPACMGCAKIDWGKRDAVEASIPEEWNQFIHWDAQEIRKRKMCVEVSCPECSETRLVEVLSLANESRKGLVCRKCTGRAFRGTPDKPARRRRLQEAEVKSEFRPYCRFDQQKVIEEASGHKLLHISVDCPMCGEGPRWKRVSEIRSLGRPPFCRDCGVKRKRRYFLDPESIREEWRPYVKCNSQQQRDGDSGPVMIQVECPMCRELRWMLLQSLRKMERNAPKGRLLNCVRCGIKRQLEAKGEKKKQKVDGYGYIVVPLSTLSPKDRTLAEAMLSHRKKRDSITEHRLVMARHLRRPLRPSEQVHHRNSVRADNRLANLRLVTPGSHPVAPKDKVAYISVEIEAAARDLQSASIDPMSILKSCLAELRLLLPKSMFEPK